MKPKHMWIELSGNPYKDDRVYCERRSASMSFRPMSSSDEVVHFIEYEAYENAIEMLKDIGSGPGYPLDHCPKCDATHKVLKFLNELGEL